MKQKLLMLKGLPASGKSTFRKSLSPDLWYYWNNDEQRELWDGVWTRKQEDELSKLRIETIIYSLDNGFSICVDDTNLNPIHEATYRKMAEKRGIEFEIKEFPLDVETCIARDKIREKPVGEKVIRDMSKKWNYPSPKREFEPIVQDKSLPKAFVFDIDGTLAFMQGRSPYDYSRVGEDGVHTDVKNILGILFACDYNIIIVSGREDNCFKETTDWLFDNGIFYKDIFMRKAGDKRNDSIIKYEILKELTKEYYIEGIFDDRARVVKMWREAGCRCYQVAEGNF